MFFLTLLQTGYSIIQFVFYHKSEKRRGAMRLLKRLGAFFVAPMMIAGLVAGSALATDTPEQPAVQPTKKEVKEVKKEIKQDEKTAKKDIINTVMSNEKLSTLLGALKTANLVETLKGPGPFTVFAPTNDAFAKLPPGTLDALMKDAPRLEKVLLYHVVPGKKPSKEIMTISSIKTSQGENLTIKIQDGKIMADNAQIVTTDIPTSNGVIHVIDTVLIPKVTK
jgi:uncharacterized surface protein with fasciclin (FAS1) repeats